jgi:hypothetical protein
LIKFFYLKKINLKDKKENNSMSTFGKGIGGGNINNNNINGKSQIKSTSSTSSSSSFSSNSSSPTKFNSNTFNNSSSTTNTPEIIYNQEIINTAKSAFRIVNKQALNQNSTTMATPAEEKIKTIDLNSSSSITVSASASSSSSSSSTSSSSAMSSINEGQSVNGLSLGSTATAVNQRVPPVGQDYE